MITAAMPDGFPTLFVQMAGGGQGVLFEEVRVKPPGLDGRAKIDTSGMRNSTMVTSWPRALRDVTDVTFVVAYDPLYWNTVQLFINGGAGAAGRTINSFTIRYPRTAAGNLREHSFYGTINKFEPGEFVEGERPTATITITIHNVNPLGVEVAPVVLAV